MLSTTRHIPNLARWRHSGQRLVQTALLPCSPRHYSTASAPTSTNLEKIISDTIKATGPISFGTYMQMCLSHPTEGYYMNPSHAVLGLKGDFTTSPEISQVFGEILGVWFLSQYMQTGVSKPIRLVELGPGRGTLTADILRVLSQFDVSKPAVKEVCLVENSPLMKGMQKGTLQPVLQRFEGSSDVKLEWYDSVENIPRNEDVFTILVAHEFFDALPFHLIRRTEKGWHEVMLATGPDPAAPTVLKSDGSSASSSTSSSFRPVLSSEPSPASMILGMSSRRFVQLPVGSQIEVSPASFKVAHQIGQLLKPVSQESYTSSTGCALIVDYGEDKTYSSSFRAFKNHQIVDPFHRPGECDLTVNVDFGYLKEAIAPNATPLGLLTQAGFLTRMGIETRVSALVEAAEDRERKNDIANAADRLVSPIGMGRQYRIMGISGLRESRLGAETRWPFLDAQNQTQSRSRNGSNGSNGR